MSRYRVAIVLGFSWGKVSYKSYEQVAKNYVEEINGLTDHVDSTYEALIFRGEDATDDALKWLNETIDIQGAIVFPTRGALDVAEWTLKRLMESGSNRRIKVIVLTGLLPDDEVLTLSKHWVHKIGWAELIR